MTITDLVLILFIAALLAFAIYAFHRYTRNSTYPSDTLVRQFPMQYRG